MKIKSIHIDNLLSFGSGQKSTNIFLGNKNYFVGSNNSGKTNVLRLIDFFQQTLQGKNPEVPYRFNEEFNPFTISIVFTIDEHFESLCEKYFQIYGEYLLNRIEYSIKDQDRYDNVLMDHYANIGDSEVTKSDLIILKTLLCKDILFNFNAHWEKEIKNYKNLIFPNDEITISISYNGRYQAKPEISILLSEDILLKNGDNFIFPGKDEERYFEDLERAYLDRFTRNVNDSIKNFPIVFNDFIVSFIDDDSRYNLRLSNDFDRNYGDRMEEIRNDYIKSFDIFQDNRNRRINLFDLIIFDISESFSLYFNSNNICGKNDINDYKDSKINRFSPKYLPSILYDMKNSNDSDINRQYYRIVNMFNKIFNDSIDIDVAVNSIFTPESIYINPTIINGNQISIKGNQSISSKIINTIQMEIKIVIRDRNNHQYDIVDAGAGLLETVYLLTILQSNSIIFVDEPALNIHPALQKDIINKMIHDNSNIQHIIITHSPYIIDVNNIENLFVFSIKNDFSQITTPKKEFLTPNELLKLNYILDERTKEMFFCKKIIFVEGATEFGAIPFITKKFNKNLDQESIQVIEVGSKNNFEIYIKIAEEFNIKYSIICDYDAAMHIENGEYPSIIQQMINLKLIKNGTIKLIDNYPKIRNKNHQEIDPAYFSRIKRICNYRNVFPLSDTFERVFIDDGHQKLFSKAKSEGFKGKPQIGRYIAQSIVENEKQFPNEIIIILKQIVN